MKQHTELEPELISVRIATDARDYLSRYFEIDGGCDLMIVERNLPNDMFGRFNPEESFPLYIIDIDEKKVMRKFPSLLEMVVGEEIGQLLFYLSHKEMHHGVLPEHLRGLIFIQKVIGCYSGMVYANRDPSRPIFLKPNAEKEKAYSLANKLYEKYKDTKLEELNRVKSLSEFNNLVQRLGV